MRACASLLAACATAQKSPPPEIRLDEPVQAQPAPEPPKPMTVVAIPEPLPLPAQLKPLPAEPRIRGRPAGADPIRASASRRPTTRRASRPTRDGYLNAIQVWPYAEGALYQVYASPGRVTDIMLQEGEELVSVSAGDTVRWIVGDTTSASGAAQRVHVLLKPMRTDLKTNLVITTNRRLYLLELTATDADLDGVGVVELSARSSSPRSSARPRAPTRQRRWRKASRWSGCASATTSAATHPPGDRCAPSTTASMSTSSSRPASRKVSCRRCSSSASAATPSSSTTAIARPTTSSIACSAPPSCAWAASKAQVVRISRTDVAQRGGS